MRSGALAGHETRKTTRAKHSLHSGDRNCQLFVWTILEVLLNSWWRSLDSHFNRYRTGSPCGVNASWQGLRL